MMCEDDSETSVVVRGAICRWCQVSVIRDDGGSPWWRCKTELVQQHKAKE